MNGALHLVRAVNFDMVLRGLGCRIRLHQAGQMVDFCWRKAKR